MRLGLITGEYPPMTGGIGTYTQIMARHMAMNGHDVFVFSDYRAEEAHTGITMSALAKHWNVLTMGKIQQWAKDMQLEVINMQYQTAAYQMSPFIHFLPRTMHGTVPFVTTFHDLRVPYLFPKAGPLRTRIVKHLAHQSSGVITTNHEDYAKLASHPHRALIPIGSNVSAPPNPQVSARQFVTAQPDDFVVAFFGFLNRTKGLTYLLESMAALRQEHIPIRLLLIGDQLGASDPTNVDYVREVSALIQRYALTDSVYSTGYVKDADVGGYLSSADAVVLPFADGASYRRSTLLIAIHYGCPILTTIPSVDVSAFVDGENMLMVQPNNVEDLTRGLSVLYNSLSLREKISQGALVLNGSFQRSALISQYTQFLTRIVEDFA